MNRFFFFKFSVISKYRQIDSLQSHCAQKSEHCMAYWMSFVIFIDFVCTQKKPTKCCDWGPCANENFAWLLPTNTIQQTIVIRITIMMSMCVVFLLCLCIVHLSSGLREFKNLQGMCSHIHMLTLTSISFSHLCDDGHLKAATYIIQKVPTPPPPICCCCCFLSYHFLFVSLLCAIFYTSSTCITFCLTFY